MADLEKGITCGIVAPKPTCELPCPMKWSSAAAFSPCPPQADRVRAPVSDEPLCTLRTVPQPVSSRLGQGVSTRAQAPEGNWS